MTRRPTSTIRPRRRPPDARVLPAPEAVEAARLRGMAELAKTLGHEMNNTAAAMLLQVEMLGEELPATGPARKQLAVLEQAAAQALALVRRVRELARLSRPLVPAPVDVLVVVDDAVDAVRTRLASSPRVEIVREHEGAPLVSGDRAELTLAVRELLSNALDAVAADGRVRVTTGVESAAIVWRVVDDGAGVAADARARAFEPFFSTHPETGRGLGLTIALAVAARHGGEVKLTPAPGGGTIATLRVPRAR